MQILTVVIDDTIYLCFLSVCTRIKQFLSAIELKAPTSSTPTQRDIDSAFGEYSQRAEMYKAGFKSVYAVSILSLSNTLDGLVK